MTKKRDGYKDPKEPIHERSARARKDFERGLIRIPQVKLDFLEYDEKLVTELDRRWKDWKENHDIQKATGMLKSPKKKSKKIPDLSSKTPPMPIEHSDVESEEPSSPQGMVLQYPSESEIMAMETVAPTPTSKERVQRERTTTIKEEDVVSDDSGFYGLSTKRKRKSMSRVESV